MKPNRMIRIPQLKPPKEMQMQIIRYTSKVVYRYVPNFSRKMMKFKQNALTVGRRLSERQIESLGVRTVTLPIPGVLSPKKATKERGFGLLEPNVKKKVST